MPLGQELAPHIPFLRRYARAVTGSQATGDALVRATLAAIAAAPREFARDVDPRVALYGRLLESLEASDRFAAIGRELLPGWRQALLLTAMEGFTPEDAGLLMNCDREEVERMADEAVSRLEHQPPAPTLIIEDEPMIAMTLEDVLSDLGHSITGIAATHDCAVAMARADPPALVLADIQLADSSCGLEAVHDIFANFRVPVVFITAFPERLLTGKRPEPAFLITKPFQISTVKAAIGQALFLNQAVAA